MTKRKPSRAPARKTTFRPARKAALKRRKPVDLDAPERLTLTAPQVAKALGISLGLVYAQIRSGSIPALKLGQRVLVPRAALERMLRGERPQGEP